MSHRTIILRSRSAEPDHPSPYDITVEYTPPHDATPEQVGAEVRRITRKVDQIEQSNE